MTQYFEAHRLDAALKSGETTDPKLAGLVKTAHQLETLTSVPSLTKNEFNSAKSAFLAQASAIAPREAMANISAENRSWLSRIKQTLQPIQGRTWVPVTALVALILFFVITFGIPGLNLASQASLPGDTLYTYKIVKEDLSASLTFDAYQKVMIYLEQIHERQQEINLFAQNGQAPPPQTVSRLEKLLDAALRAAALLPDTQMQNSLSDIQQASQDLSETIAQAKPSVQGPVGVQTLAQAESATKNTLALVNQGLRDPDGFRVNMAAPRPIVNLPSATSTAKVVYPPVEPTPIVGWPTPTLGVMNPPLTQPTPVCTCTPTQAVQEPIQPSNTPTEAAKPTNTNPPPILPTPTEIYIQPTQVAPTPTPTPTTPSMPQPPTATPVYMEQGN